MSQDEAEKALARFCPWLYAAAIYNLLWGALTILVPEALFRPHRPRFLGCKS